MLKRKKRGAQGGNERGKGKGSRFAARGVGGEE